MESNADISVPLERVEWGEGGPPMEMCEHFGAFSGNSNMYGQFCQLEKGLLFIQFIYHPAIEFYTFSPNLYQ